MGRKSDLRSIVWEVWDKNPGLAPKEIRAEIIQKLGPKCSNNGEYPCQRSVEIYVKEFKERLGKSVGEEQPWNVLTERIYEIPAEALPAVLEVWADALRNKFPPLTIREAKWVSRLYKVIPDYQLHQYAIKYAAYEKSSIASGDKVAEIVKFVGFRETTELYVDIFHPPKLTTKETVKVDKDPYILKRKRQQMLRELRNPETLRLLGLDSSNYLRELEVKTDSNDELN